jgi:hypothetical protein
LIWLQKKSRRDFFDAQKFAQTLGALIDTLPSEASRQRVVSQLELLIQFLTDLKGRLAAIPTQEDAIRVREALDDLAALFTQAKSNPVLGTAIGVSMAPQRAKPPTITAEEVERAKLVIARFEPLPIDQLRASLAEMSARDLKAVANVLGIRSTQRTSHDALSHQIATKITNTRGYRSLRDGAE